MSEILSTYSKANYPSPAVISALTQTQKSESATSSLRGWLEEAAAMIERHSLEILGWNRKMSATLAHLRQAYAALSQAEEKIGTLQERINLLQDLTTTDDLTGLKNRRGFREGFERELEVCRRMSSQGGLLVMIDLDNFKTVNDTYGHQAGDAALKLVARTLEQEIRKTDMAARLGGDEFVLLLSNTTKTKAVARAQMISWQLNNLSLAWYGEVIALQASIGLKEFNGNDSADQIIRCADNSLYASKASNKGGQTGTAR